MKIAGLLNNPSASPISLISINHLAVAPVGRREIWNMGDPFAPEGAFQNHSKGDDFVVNSAERWRLRCLLGFAGPHDLLLSAMNSVILR